jgi:DNA ligase (NAD+)
LPPFHIILHPKNPKQTGVEKIRITVMEDINAILDTLVRYNEAYRAGKPLVEDRQYDDLVERLRALAPEHPFLHQVEPEFFTGKREVSHPAPMLSTEKAYTREQLIRFVDRVERAAIEVGVSDVRFRVTPKLDGLAGRDNGKVFVTRGNGFVGYEISSVFQKGVVPVGGRGRGLGEIVIVESYFNHRLAGEFVHPRNMAVGIVSSDILNPHAQRALNDGVVRFVPYDTLPSWEGSGKALVDGISDITSELSSGLDFPTDGMVVDVMQEKIRHHMGATTHHYRWQIAVKTRGETAVTIVEGIEWQVGRTGKITPVLRVTPVDLSGATIRRVTAHHAGLIEKLKIGPGAQIEIIRSGEVIPKLEQVIKSAKSVTLPTDCPSCGTRLTWENDFLKCPNPECKGQQEQTISHFFRTLGNADWFGIKTIQRLVAGGFNTLQKIYSLTERELLDLGFGPVQTQNLLEAVSFSRTRPVEDWRFLAAFGISDLGKGDSRKILEHHRLENLEYLTVEDLLKIRGFGEVTAPAIVADIKKLLPVLRYMLNLSFNLTRTPLASTVSVVQSPISGQGIVFTGKMSESRSIMEAGARRLGAQVQSAVTGNTRILVCGEDVGEKKMEKARKLGVRTISEAEYRALIAPKEKEGG